MYSAGSVVLMAFGHVCENAKDDDGENGEGDDYAETEEHGGVDGMGLGLV